MVAARFAVMDDAAMPNAMNKKESSAAGTEAFEGAAADLAGAGVVPGQTFGARALLVNRKAWPAFTAA
ncbi:hypothetical protein BJG92_01705 [Arthrobacter sp. SO5]|nr:hypothetical protein [Arthrobacter sp. SO5]